MFYSVCAVVCVVWVVLCVSSCPVDHDCLCKGTVVLCVGPHLYLDKIPDNLPRNTTRIKLEHVGIIGIETSKLQHLHNLTYLNLNYNNIQTIQPHAFDNLVLLKELSLKHNNISTLPQGVFSKLHNLKDLLLENNQLVSLENVLNGLFSLELLVAKNNQISQLTVDTFTDLRKLRVLSLASNNISTIDNQTFRHLRHMLDLSLATNPLYKLDVDLSEHDYLVFINLNECHLTHFPRLLPSNIQRLSLHTNSITSISRSDTARFDSLHSLILDGNKLRTVEEGAFSHLHQMTSLKLSNNSLQSIPGPLPEGLHNVFLDNNSIHTVLQDSFHPTTQLLILSLNNNNITSITSQTFSNIKYIQNLVLDLNPISELRDDMFSNETKITNLSLKNLFLDKIHSEVFRGLDSLSSLDMSHVYIKASQIQGNIFRNTPNLNHLDISSSPGLANYILSSEDVMKSLSALLTINLAQNQLTKLSSNFVDFLPNLKKINLIDNVFICDSELFWIHHYMLVNVHKFHNPFNINCVDPNNSNRFMNLLSFEYYDGVMENSTAYEDVSYPAPGNYDYEYKYDYGPSQDYDDHLYDYYKDLESTGKPFQTNSTISSTASDNVTISTVTAPSLSSTIKPAMSPTSNPLRAVGIAIGMAFAVIVIMLLLAMMIYMCCRCRRRHTRADGLEYQAEEDYVLIVTKTDTQTDTGSMPRMTRDQRGSTTSRASEDITNHTDRSLMGVFTLDVDT